MVMGWFGPEAPSIKRLYAGALTGLVALAAAIAFAPWQADVVVFWDGVAASFLVTVWYQIRPLDAAATAVAARREDETRTMTRIILITAAMVSLVGVGLVLAKATQEGGGTQFVLTILAVVTIILSWGVMNTAYVLRYAHLYYDHPHGGVNFYGVEPDYFDFAYLAFTIGMTYQVSDTDVGKSAIRRAVLGHALLSYVFGAVIIAATINIVASFVH
jgi:uncharacterized membrane protein